jgi:hypothetical protein
MLRLFLKPGEGRSTPATDKISNQAFHKVNEIKSFLVSGSVNEFEMQGTYDV